MAHFSHTRELETKAVQLAIKRIQNTGAVIRTQSPVLKHINDDAKVWAEMWHEQVKLGCIPYYMFVERDTGSKAYFELPLIRAWEIFEGAVKKIIGACTNRARPIDVGTPRKGPHLWHS